MKKNVSLFVCIKHGIFKFLYTFVIHLCRDSSLVATTIVDNKDRVVSGIAPLPHKISSIRPDLVLFRDGSEYGAAECGKDDECGIGRKEIIETGLHSHKVMKSMFLHLADKCDNQQELLRSLRVVFFGQFRKYCVL